MCLVFPSFHLAVSFQSNLFWVLFCLIGWVILYFAWFVEYIVFPKCTLSSGFCLSGLSQVTGDQWLPHISGVVIKGWLCLQYIEAECQPMVSCWCCLPGSSILEAKGRKKTRGFCLQLPAFPSPWLFSRHKCLQQDLLPLTIKILLTLSGEYVHRPAEVREDRVPRPSDLGLMSKQTLTNPNRL